MKKYYLLISGVGMFINAMPLNEDFSVSAYNMLFDANSAYHIHDDLRDVRGTLHNNLDASDSDAAKKFATLLINASADHKKAKEAYDKIINHNKTADSEDKNEEDDAKSILNGWDSFITKLIDELKKGPLESSFVDNFENTYKAMHNNIGNTPLDNNQMIESKEFDDFSNLFKSVSCTHVLFGPLETLKKYSITIDDCKAFKNNLNEKIESINVSINNKKLSNWDFYNLNIIFNIYETCYLFPHINYGRFISTFKLGIDSFEQYYKFIDSKIQSSQGDELEALTESLKQLKDAKVEEGAILDCDSIVALSIRGKAISALKKIQRALDSADKKNQEALDSANKKRKEKLAKDLEDVRLRYAGESRAKSSHNTPNKSSSKSAASKVVYSGGSSSSSSKSDDVKSKNNFISRSFVSIYNFITYPIFAIFNGVKSMFAYLSSYIY